MHPCCSLFEQFLSHLGNLMRRETLLAEKSAMLPLLHLFSCPYSLDCMVKIWNSIWNAESNKKCLIIMIITSLLNQQKRIKNALKLNSGLYLSILLMKHSYLRWFRQTLCLSVFHVATWTGPRLLARCRLWELHGFNSCNNAHLMGSDISFVALFQSKSYPWVQKHHEKSIAKSNSREQVNSLNNSKQS